jgi:hypothetical protein
MSLFLRLQTFRLPIASCLWISHRYFCTLIHEQTPQPHGNDAMASASLQMPVKDHDPLQVIDLPRVDAGRRADQGRKQAFAQFFTPAPVARFMAGLFQCAGKEIHILDAGAGVGSLFAAAVAELCRRATRPKRIAATAYEVDESLAVYLQDTLKICAACCRQAGIAFTGQLERADFLERTAELVAGDLFS